MTQPVESVSAFHAYAGSVKLTLASLEKLFNASCGYMHGLRAAGLKVGDAVYNDGSFCNMEIQRYAREVFKAELALDWWRP